MLSVQSLGQNNTTFGKGRNYAKKAEQAIKKYYQGDISARELGNALYQNTANKVSKDLSRMLFRNTKEYIVCMIKSIFKK